MRLLALDLSLTASGVVDPDGNPDTLRPPKKMMGDDRLDWWRQTFTVLLDQHQPTRIAVEHPIGGFPSGAIELHALYGIFRMAVRDHGKPIPISWVWPSQLKKAWTGKGNATKGEMRVACRDWGVDAGDGDDGWGTMRLRPPRTSPHDDNAIDALALWHTTRDGMWDNPAGDTA
jgi:hypothetical protein